MRTREPVVQTLLGERWQRWRLGPPDLAGRFSREHGWLLALAAVVGIYAGIAAGLLSNFVALFQTLFFQGLQGGLLSGDWTDRLAARAREARWHLEFGAVGALAVLFGWLSPRVARRFPGAAKLLEPRLARAVGFLAGFGLLLFYPLLLLAILNRSLGSPHGDLVSVLENSPLVLRLLVPALGGLLVGFIVRRIVPEAGGHGVAEVLAAVSGPGRAIPARVAFWKPLVAGLTIGSGGSAGREGPVVQMGSAVGNAIGVRLGLPREDLRLLLACGAGAGIAASFNAPIAGTMFALELILRDFGVRSFSPIVVSAVTATITSRAVIGAGGELAHIEYAIRSPVEMGGYAVLGLLAAFVAVVYARSLTRAEAFFEGQGLSRLSKKLGGLRLEVRTAIAGLCVGAIGLVVPRALGNGYETMNEVLANGLPAGVLFVVLAAKVVTTGLTLGSGSPGGSFFPAVFLGAMLGGLFGQGMQALLPSHAAHPAAYAAVGMAAVVGAATQGPLTAVSMLFELTGSYEIVLPLMVACSVAVGLARMVLGGSMYKLRRGETAVASPPASGARVLAALRVGQAMSQPPLTVRDNAPPPSLRALRETEGHRAYPVVDQEGRLVGLLSFDDVAAFLSDSSLDAVTVARDLCREHPPTVRASDTLEAALMRMSTQRTDHLVVVDEADPLRVVGVLTPMDVMAAYQKAVLAGEAGGENGEASEAPPQPMGSPGEQGR